MSDNDHCLICGAHPCDSTKNHDLTADATQSVAQVIEMFDDDGLNNLFYGSATRLRRTELRQRVAFRPDIGEDPDLLSGLGIRPTKE